MNNFIENKNTPPEVLDVQLRLAKLGLPVETVESLERRTENDFVVR